VDSSVVQRSPASDALRAVAIVALVVVLGIGLLYAARAQTPDSILLALLPILLLAALVLLAAYALSRSRRGDAYEQLARIADLRDRGVLSEDEFQREKRRLLR
jgi:uncharacterized membrane protein